MTDAANVTERTDFFAQPVVAFFTALVSAPLAVALFGALLLPVYGIGFIFVFAAPFGAPSYLAIFAPAAWWSITRGAWTTLDFTVIGFAANLVGAAVTILAVGAGSQDLETALGAAAFVHGFGLVFAPLFAALFGVFFNAMVDRSRLSPRCGRDWGAAA